MEKRDFVKRLYAGIFFIIGIVLILVVVLAIGMEKGLMQPKFPVQVLFREVGGLSVGAPIRLSGVNIGTVGQIDFLPEKFQGRGVVVTMSIFSRYKTQLEYSGKIAIKTEGILGEKIIEISADEFGRMRNLAQPIIGEDPLDVQDLAESFGDSARSLTLTSKGINDIIEELHDMGRTTKRLLNRIEQRVVEGNIFSVF